MPQSKIGSVYVVVTKTRIKVGFSTNYRARINTLAKNIGEPLTLHAVYHQQAKEKEQQFHRLYKEIGNHEWYDFSQNTLFLISDFFRT